MEQTKPDTPAKVPFWQRFRGTIASLAAIVTLIGMFFGAFQFIDTTYATDNHVEYLSKKLDVKILNDRANRLLDREWSLEDRKQKTEPNTPMATEIDKQLRQAQSERKTVDRELQITLEKYKDAEGQLDK